jgi:adenine-specific DNA methylase
MLDICRCIPYLGSKEKIRVQLMNAMLLDFKQRTGHDAECFVDVFGGGGSMSIQAMKMGLNTYYNDLDKAPYEILTHIKNNGKFTLQTINKEQFRELKSKENKTPQDYANLIIYSFGTGAKNYL